MTFLLPPLLRPRRLAAAAAAVAASVILTACANSTDDSATLAQSEQTTAAQTPTPTSAQTEPEPTVPDYGPDTESAQRMRDTVDRMLNKGSGDRDDRDGRDGSSTNSGSTGASSLLAREATATFGGNRAAVDAAGDGSRNTSGPERQDYNYNLPVSVPTAGMTVGFDADGVTQACTLGFLAEVDGRLTGVTSGHCRDNASTTDARLRLSGGDEPARFGDSCNDLSACGDQGLVEYHQARGADGRIAGRYEISELVDDPGDIPVGTEVCKYGRVTGETCGEMIGAKSHRFHAAAFSLQGDSGSPGYIKNDDGTVTLVGLLSGSPNGVDGKGNDNVGTFVSARHVFNNLGLDSVIGTR